MFKVIIPKIEANTEEVTLVKWLKKENDIVKKGEPLFSIETAKAVIDVEAEESGILKKILVQEGESVPVLTVVAFIEGKSESISYKTTPIEEPKEEVQKVRATPAAKRVAKKHNVDLISLYKGNLIHEKDILDYISIRKSEKREYNIRPEFVNYLKNNLNKIKSLENAEKIKIYQENGAHIGKNVNLIGTIIIAKQIHIGEGVSLVDSYVKCNVFKVGDYTKLGKNARITCRKATFGKNIYGDENIVIGGGGHKDPWAEIDIGDWCYLGENISLNTCRKITLGRESFITKNTIIATHSFAQSVLDGFNATFAPVRIGNYCQIGMNCIIYPGVQMGDYAVLASGSHLVTDLPGGMFATGVPAKVIKKSRKYLTLEQQKKILKNILEEFVDLISYRGAVTETKDDNYIIKASGKIYFLSIGPIVFQKPAKVDNIIIITLNSKDNPKIPEASLFDIEKKEIFNCNNILAIELREFLRKRGIRFMNIPHQYEYQEIL